MTEPREPRRPDAGEDLRWLLSDAVSDVDPPETLDSIRNRTKVTSMSVRRPGLFAVGGAVVATAAVVTAVAFAGGSLTGGDADSGPPPADRTSTAPTEPEPTEDSPTADSSASEAPTPSAPPEPGDVLVTGIYYVGDTPAGPRLYREFHGVDRDDAGNAALQQAATTPDDPDYRTLWSPEDIVGGGADQTTGALYVELSDSALRERPAGLDTREAEMAVQSLVYTVQAIAQSRDPVEFRIDGQPVDQVLGVPTPEPVANAPVLDTLSHVSITSPEEGAAVPGQLEVTGVANSFEANVQLQLQRPDGRVVADGFATAAGWMGEKLFPFTGTLDLADVTAGDYVLVAKTDDPSGGAEGPGAFTDTRNVVIAD